MVPGDVHDEATLIRLLAGADAVVNLVAILHGSEAAFEQVHVELPKKLARACAAAGVRGLVQISALGAALDGPSMYQRSKARGEAVLHTEAAADFLDLTVLRPSVILSRMSSTVGARGVAGFLALAGLKAGFDMEGSFNSPVS